MTRTKEMSHSDWKFVLGPALVTVHEHQLDLASLLPERFGISMIRKPRIIVVSKVNYKLYINPPRVTTNEASGVMESPRTTCPDHSQQ